MRHLLKEGKTTKELDFMGGKIDVKKTTLKDLREIQERAQAENWAEDPDKGLEATKLIIRRFVVDAEDMTDEEFEEFPVEDLIELAQRLMGNDVGNG